MWNRTYNIAEPNWDFSIVEASDGGFAIAGTWGFLFFSRDTQAGWETFIEGDCCAVNTDEFGVVPEYSSFLIPTLVLMASALILINKKRLPRRNS